jgi:hypothetical protein
VKTVRSWREQPPFRTWNSRKELETIFGNSPLASGAVSVDNLPSYLSTSITFSGKSLCLPHATFSRRVAIGAILLLAVPPTAFATDSKSSVESLLTSETIDLLHVRRADVWNRPSMAFCRKMLGSLGADETEVLDRKFAPNPL